jgi:hypothetical protein
MQVSKSHHQLVSTSHGDLASRNAMQHQGSLEEQMAKYRWAARPTYEAQALQAAAECIHF